MNVLDSFVSWSLTPIFLIFFNIKVAGDRHFKIFLRFFFFDYHDFPITKMIYLFLMLYALQLLLEWKWLLKIMGVIPEDE